MTELAKPIDQMTRGERVCAFIESFCCVPEGTLVGQPLHLEDFERRFILDVYDNPHGTRLAILSIAKKNGKTPLIAGILLAHIAGPEAKQNSQIVSGAMSQKQAATVFKYAWKMVQMSPKLQTLVRVRPSVKQLIGIALNVEYSAISRQKKTAHGIAPAIALLDELGQVRGQQDDFVEAIETALGAYDDAILFVISTQAASDGDMLSCWIDDYRENKDPHTVCHVYEADADCDVLDRAQWSKSNPALGIFRSLHDMEQLALKAKRMPSFEASFRNLNLNQRVETFSPLISHGVWLANSFEPDREALQKADIYAALDLSKRTDLCSLTCVGLFKDRWQVFQWFWAPQDGVHERSKRDRQPYAVWAKQGLIRLVPGASIDYDVIAQDLKEIFADVKKLKALAYDRWRMDVMEQAIARTQQKLPLVPFGQGFKDMSPAIDELETILLNDRMSHGNHPVLTMCAKHAIAVKDEVENRKLDKRRATARIDGIVTLTMAIGTAVATLKKQPKYSIHVAGG